MVQIIDNALEEDVWTGDITTRAVIDDKAAVVTGVLKVKESGVVAGLKVAEQVFYRLNSEVDVRLLIKDGTAVKAGEIIAEVSGPAGAILTAERTALNFLQRMSGIATKTAKYQELVTDYDVKIVDTRKTTPGLRILEKYAVKVGGGANHRLGLYDAVMIKDNHLRAVGDIGEAVRRARADIPHTMKIEVEVETLTEVEEALQAEADIIMLDNMPPKLMAEAVEKAAGSAIVEASGGITVETIQEVAATGVDIISLGTLTHTIRSLDISLDLKSN